MNLSHWFYLLACMFISMLCISLSLLTLSIHGAASKCSRYDCYLSTIETFAAMNTAVLHKPAKVCELALLRLHLPILLNMDMLVRLQNADLIVWELDREALDQRELVLNLPAVRLGLIFGLCELFGRGVLFECHLEDGQ